MHYVLIKIHYPNDVLPVLYYVTRYSVVYKHIIFRYIFQYPK